MGESFGFAKIDGLEDFIVWVLWGFIVAPALFVIGLILLLVGAFSGNRQQQQQQVVIHIQGGALVGAGPTASPAGVQLRCPACKGLSQADAAFCGHCGRTLGAVAVARRA